MKSPQILRGLITAILIMIASFPALAQTIVTALQAEVDFGRMRSGENLSHTLDLRSASNELIPCLAMARITGNDHQFFDLADLTGQPFRLDETFQQIQQEFYPSPLVSFRVLFSPPGPGDFSAELRLLIAGRCEGFGFSDPEIDVILDEISFYIINFPDELPIYLAQYEQFGGIFEELVIPLRGQGICDAVQYNCEPDLALCRVDANADFLLAAEVGNFTALAQPGLRDIYQLHYPYVHRNYRISISQLLQLMGLTDLLEDTSDDFPDLAVTRIGLDRKARISWSGTQTIIGPRPNLPSTAPQISLELPSNFEGYIVVTSGYIEFFFLNNQPRVSILQGADLVFDAPIICSGTSSFQAIIKQRFIGTEAAPNIEIRQE